MKINEYIKDNLFNILINLISIFIVSWFMSIFNCGIFLQIYLTTILLVAQIYIFTRDFIKKKNYYNNVIKKLDELDKKYLLSEVIPKGNFLEANILENILKETNKSMADNVSLYNSISKDYKEYIELWIHEVKTPISTAKLIVENNKDSVTESIGEEIDKIDNYVEQALFYSRIDCVSKDYIIKKVFLQDIVNTVIRKNMKLLISKDISIGLENLNLFVYSDCKWLEYIINQIVNNSIKYINNTNNSISIYTIQDKEYIELHIKDTGIGISRSSINRIFDKGYTGETGRIYSKSTGMGLYICSELCNKLNHNLNVLSKENTGTDMIIRFPVNSYTEFE